MQYFNPNYMVQSAQQREPDQQAGTYDSIMGAQRNMLGATPDWFQGLVQKRFSEGKYGGPSNIENIYNVNTRESDNVKTAALGQYNQMAKMGGTSTPWIYGEGGKSYQDFDILDTLDSGGRTYGVSRYKFDPTQASQSQLVQDYLSGGNVDAFDIWLQQQGLGNASSVGWGEQAFRPNQWVGSSRDIGYNDRMAQNQMARQNFQNSMSAGPNRGADLYRQFLQNQYGSGRDVFTGAWV